MAMQTEMRANIVAGVDKASFNDGINYARDTGKKIDQALKAKLELDLAGFQLKLDDARRSLRDAKKLGDENLRYKAQLDVNSLTSSVTYAKGQLENLKATGDKDTSRLQLKFNMLAEEARKMGQEISRVGLSINQVASLDKKLNDVDNAFKKGTISASQYNAEIKKIGDETRRLQGQKGGLGEIGNILVGAGLVTGISAVSNSIVTLAGNLEQARISFGVMLGSAEKADVLLKDLSEFAKKTPFELVGLREQAKLLKGYGFETEQIIPTLEKLGNISAAIGVDKMPRLVYALAQVRAAGKLTGQDFRQFTETGVGLGAELEKITGIAGIHSGNVAEIGITYQQVEQALTNLTAKGGQYAGLMEAQSKTLQGVRSNFKDSMNILGEQIGSLFLPILTVLARGFASVAQSISNASQQFPFLTKVVGSLIALFGLFVAGLGAYTAILPIATALTGTLGISMTALGSAITFALGPISLIIAGLYALTKAYQSNFLGFKDFVDGFIDKVQLVYEVSKIVFDKLSTLFDTLKSIFGKAYDVVASTTDSMYSKVSQTLKKLNDKISEVNDGIYSGIRSIIGSFLSMLGIKDVVSNVFGFVSNYIQSKVDIVRSAVGSLVNALAQITGLSGIVKQARINATDQSQFGPKAYDPSGGLSKNISTLDITNPKPPGGSPIDKEKKELDAKIKIINDEADARILALSRTKKSREKNSQEIIDIDRKREEAIKEIQGKSADIQIDKAKKVVEEAKKNFETTKSSAEKAFDEVSKAIDKSADSVKKLNDDLKAVNDSLAEIDQTIGSRVVAIEQELADTNLSYEQRRKLEEELALAKSSITSEELAKAREEEAKSETQKLLDKRTVLEERKKQLEDELAFEKTISENLATAKIELEKKIADAHEAELERQKNATTVYANSVIEMYKQIEIAAKKASEAGSAVFGGGTIPGRAVGGPVSAGSPYIVGEKGPEMFVPHNSGTIIPNNVLNNNINVNANVANGIDMDVLANTLAHKIALTRKGVF